MRLRRFYREGVLTNDLEAVLDKRVSNHLANVLRLKAGDVCTVFNGNGKEYFAEIIRADKRRTIIRITGETYPESESNLKIHLAQCVSKGERMDYTVQKAAELGVAQITPVISERVVVRLALRRWQKKLNHWRQIAISACEQSLRVKIPLIHQPLGLEDFVCADSAAAKYIFDTEAEHTLGSFSRPGGDITVLAGPEGGLAGHETSLAENNGFARVWFGPRVLRTETVAPAALAVMQCLWGDICENFPPKPHCG